jgi:hypothetical protein
VTWWADFTAGSKLEKQSVEVEMGTRFNLLSQFLTDNGAGLALHESGWMDRGNNKVAGQNLEQLRANTQPRKHLPAVFSHAATCVGK